MRTGANRLIPLCSLLLGLTACTAQPATPVANPVQQPTVAATATTAPTTALSTTTISAEVVEAEAAPPIRLHFAALDLTVAVEPMAWIVADVNGERQAVWEIPQLNAGWHLNSAMVGAPGNMIISGHHLQGAAVFAPLARGELRIGDPILVTDEQGQTYTYEVSEVADPLPAAGATTAESEQAASYLAPTVESRLTLVTGWPDFSDTHYLFVVAQLVGPTQP
jgi:Sortase domain